MAAAPAELGDFFAKNKKKKVKGTNLNNTSTTTKTEEKKTKASKDKDDEDWQEEHVETAEMKVAAAGKLTRDEEKKEDEDTAAPAWGSSKSKANAAPGNDKNLSDKRFPSLAKSVHNINLDDGSEGKINIKTTKNAFAALEDDYDDDEELPKRPREIKPAMVQKRKGEAEKAAIEREVDKYGGKNQKGEEIEKRKGEKKKKDKKKKEEDEEEPDEGEDEEEDDAEDGRKKKDKKKKAAEMKAEDESEDMKIVPDLEATLKKYEGRCKLPRKELPESEMEEKENRPSQAKVQASQKKRKVALEEEDYDKPKLAFAPPI